MNIDLKKKTKIFLALIVTPAAILVLWQLASMAFGIESPTRFALKESTSVYYSIRHDDFVQVEKKLPAKLNVLVVGLDSRLAKGGSNADAIHLVTINTKTMSAKITSVPRDTYMELPMADSTQQKVTYARNFLGRKGFLRRMEEFFNEGRIHYSVEVTFSQVMGILELLGYQDPGKAMHFLRNRKSFHAGDYQRAHNQANFMKRAFERNFHLFAGASGDVLLSVGLSMIDTEMPKDVAQTLIYKLYERGFPSGADRIALKMKPEMHFEFADLAPTPEEMNRANDSLYEAMSDRFKDEQIGRPDAFRILSEFIARAEGCRRYPRGVIQVLSTTYRQRGWLQIQSRFKRVLMREKITTLLADAYEKVGEREEAQAVRDYLQQEKKLFDLKMHVVWDELENW